MSFGGKVWHTESRFRNHPLPTLLLRLLPRPYRLEHLLLNYTPIFRQRDRILRRFLRSLIFNGAG